jgi:hypothetical protein
MKPTVQRSQLGFSLTVVHAFNTDLNPHDPSRSAHCVHGPQTSESTPPVPDGLELRRIEQGMTFGNVDFVAPDLGKRPPSVLACSLGFPASYVLNQFRRGATCLGHAKRRETDPDYVSSLRCP